MKRINMASYVITSQNNTFDIFKDGETKTFEKDIFIITVSEEDVNTLILYNKYEHQVQYSIYTDTDIINVDGITSFANAEELKQAIIVFAETNSGNTESVVNSTTTPLLIGETFTGVGELNGLTSVVVQVKTDQDCTYYMDFSPDGTNWDTSLSFNYKNGQINPPQWIVKFYRYFRVRLINTSGVDQTYLRLNTYYSNSSGVLSAPINGTLSESFSASVVRPTDYRSEVAMGKRQGRSLWNKFGHNNDVDVGTEVIASWGGTFNPLTVPTTLIIASSSANDTNGGTGCNSIVVYGVDENRDEKIEVVTLNGTTSVVTVSTWLGINRVAMFLCGSSQVNEGEINIIATTGGSTMAQMPLGDGVTQQCIFHVPRNYTFLTEYLLVNVLNRGKNAELKITLVVYSPVNNGKQEVLHIDVDTAVTNEPIQLNPNLPFPITEKSVIWMEATSDTANVVVNARFSGILERIS